MLALLKQHLKHFLLFELLYELSPLTLIEQSSRLVLRTSCILSLRNWGLSVVGAPNYESQSSQKIYLEGDDYPIFLNTSTLQSEEDS